MLGKAKIKSKCKGDDTSNVLILDTKKIRRVLANSIPVLSIFALMGIISLGVMLPSNGLTRLFGIDKLFGSDNLLEDSNKAYAETYTASDASGNSAVSLTIGGAGETEQAVAGRGNTVYRTHTITLNADNIESYALTIAGNPNMTNPSGNSTVDTITSTNGNVIGNNLVDNTWGYYYGEYNSTNGNSKETVVYQPLVPTGTTIDSGSPSDHTITNQTKNLVFAAKFGEDIMPGRYYANVDLSIVATPRTITYTLNYNANGGTGTVPATQTMTTTSDSYEFTVANQGNLTKTGYSFLGWSESSTATSAQYVAGSKITLSSTTPSRVLYAVWKENVVAFPSSLTTMQGMTASICKATSIGQTKTLIDTRDSSAYIIAKLNNGNCWMTQNLYLAGRSLNSVDSDVSSFYLPGSNSTTFTAANQYTASVYIADTHKGYYSWAAATAGAGTTSSATSSTISICAKGWKLPSVNDYNRLISLGDYSAGDGGVNMGGAFWPYDGAFYNGYAHATSNGYYATTSAGSTTNQTVMKVYNGAPMIDGNVQRYTGASVRCVAYSN